MTLQFRRFLAQGIRGIQRGKSGRREREKSCETIPRMKGIEPEKRVFPLDSPEEAEKGWRCRDLNPGHCGYEPHALTT